MINSDSGESITILGSTGSIGCSTIQVISKSQKSYNVIALTANRNVSLLAEQAKSLNAKIAVIADESLYQDLKDALFGSNVEARAGQSEVVNAASVKVDIVMSSIVGVAGLLPTMSAIKTGTKVALANKECLVCAGDIMTDAVKKYGSLLIPVDSEHNAIFQIFDYNNINNIEKIILTASGGPFREFSKEQMRDVKVKQALTHPNWSMGNKITIDSATMMNKGLEIIEAYHLFPIDKKQIAVVVHPESIVHSFVEYKDGSVLAQLGSPDMRTPIAVALGWPERMSLGGNKLDITKEKKLTFYEADEDIFESLALAKEALTAGGSMPAVLNSANEVAVAAFLAEKIGFLDIPLLVKNVMYNMGRKDIYDIDDVIACVDEASKISIIELQKIC
jgi:1-deoxy-D-xylulose-5-phosphate reductoisomerase